MHKLEAKDLKKTIKKSEIIKGISLEVNSGEVVGLLGPNGAGKTTTFLYDLRAHLRQLAEMFFLNDEKITNVPLHKRAHLWYLAILPQESSIFKELSVEENLLLGAEILNQSKEDIAKRVNEMLNMLNIEPIRLRKGVSLSGGERRRCEIARSLIIKPKFLLLDEPFAGVDPIAVSDIQSIVRDLKKLGIGVLITDHNVRETLAICDRAYVIKDGSLLASGSASEVANNKLVRTHYLGEEFKLLE